LGQKKHVVNSKDYRQFKGLFSDAPKVVEQSTTALMTLKPERKKLKIVTSEKVLPPISISPSNKLLTGKAF
jgi:hypothetical protein